MPDQDHSEHTTPADTGLRRMLIWVLIALVITVLAAIVAVEVTLRWFGER
jgi:hypothetical protein